MLSLVALVALLKEVASGTSLLGTTYSCPQVDRTQICPAYCTYTINSNFNLFPQCAASQWSNGGCNACDSSLFTFTSNYCVPHLFDSEAEQAYLNFHHGIDSPDIGSHKLGYSTGYDSGVFVMQKRLTSLSPHYAVRIRFGIYLINNQRESYNYPLTYELDTTSYSYNQANRGYFSCHDIINSPKVPHFRSVLRLSFSNTDKTQPINTHASPSPNNCPATGCQCNRCVVGCGCACGCGDDDCCEDRYIQIRDILVFASLCPDFCLTCISASTCTSCIAGYFLNEADRLCYVSCPQATYLEPFGYLLGNAANATYTPMTAGAAGTPYVESYVRFCVPCDNLCMECLNFTFCTRCYTTGRNQSYLFNNTCVTAPCPHGFFANMTNHTCDCPEDYFYPIISADTITMLCRSCAFQCVRCSGPTNLECTVCETGYFLANGTTFCLNKCPDGEYIHPYILTCYLCDVSCSTCSHEAPNCTGCTTKSDRYLFGNKCVTSCPPGYSWNNVSRTCDLCDYYSYSYLGACVSVCPSFYKASLENRSCTSYARSGYQFSLVLQQVHVLDHGKLLQYTIFAEDGLNATSQDWMKYHSYEGVQVLYKDEKLSGLVGVRSLANVSLSIRNINYGNNRIVYTTNLPQGLDYHKSFQVVFLSSLYSQHGIAYGNETTVFYINQNPQLMREYYQYSVTNYYNLILLPFLIVALFLLLLLIKGTYEMLIETIRILQVLGLLVYVGYPLGENSFFFLIGCSYFNLDFVPNLYAKLAKTSANAYISSYQLAVSDMDFVRLVGSILFFGACMLLVYLICKFLLKAKESKLEFISRLTVDLLQVKILHSFWSSFIYIIVNAKESEFGLIAVFLLALCLVVALVARRYTLYRETKDFSYLFAWRVVGTLLICCIALANELLLGLVLVAGLGATLSEFVNLHSENYKVSINDLSSQNYMDERTIRVLNDYDLEVKYSFAISLRNTLIIVCPLVTAFLACVLILLRDQELFSVFLSVGILYLMLLLTIVTLVLVFLFLQERRKFLVQSKLEYLQKKYAKLGSKETIVYEERKRPRVMSTHYNFEEDKYYEGLPNRSMMKSFD